MLQFRLFVVINLKGIRSLHSQTYLSDHLASDHLQCQVIPKFSTHCLSDDEWWMKLRLFSLYLDGYNFSLIIQDRNIQFFKHHSDLTVNYQFLQIKWNPNHNKTLCIIYKIFAFVCLQILLILFALTILDIFQLICFLIKLLTTIKTVTSYLQATFFK